MTDEFRELLTDVSDVAGVPVGDTKKVLRAVGMLMRGGDGIFGDALVTAKVLLEEVS